MAEIGKVVKIQAGDFKGKKGIIRFLDDADSQNAHLELDNHDGLIVVPVSALEILDEGMYGSSIYETLVNTAAFAGIQMLTGGKVMSRRTIRFLVQSLVYEIFVEAYVSKWYITEDQPKAIKDLMNASDFANAANKTIGMSLIVDSITRLIMKEPQMNRDRMMYAAEMFGAITVGNVGQRYTSKATPELFKHTFQ